MIALCPCLALSLMPPPPPLCLPLTQKFIVTKGTKAHLAASVEVSQLSGSRLHVPTPRMRRQHSRRLRGQYRTSTVPLSTSPGERLRAFCPSCQARKPSLASAEAGRGTLPGSPKQSSAQRQACTTKQWAVIEPLETGVVVKKKRVGSTDAHVWPLVVSHDAPK